LKPEGKKQERVFFRVWFCHFEVFVSQVQNLIVLMESSGYRFGTKNTDIRAFTLTSTGLQISQSGTLHGEKGTT